jgi:hypothetical protein
MLRHTILALTLGLTLAGTGVRADDTNNASQNQPEAQPSAPANGDTQPTQPANPAAPDAAQPNQAAPNAAAQDQQQPNAADPNAQPANPAPANPADPNAQSPDATPANPAQPNAGTPDQAQPIQQPSDQNQGNQNQGNQNQGNQNQGIQNQGNQNTGNQGQPSAGQPGQSGEQGADMSGAGGTPLQMFVSQQVDEVGMLGEQMDVFRAAKRQDAVMAMYHMIRDHRLVADAAQNVLARRGDATRPKVSAMAPMPQDPQEIIRQQIQHHEQALTQTQQLLSSATTPEERNIYQRSVDVTNKHLAWLRAMDQGQQVRIGFFGPTIPLARIAGYREQASFGQQARPVQQTRRYSRHQRSSRSRHGSRGRSTSQR